MSISVLLRYDLGRAMQIFKPLPLGDARNTLQHAAFFTAVRSPINRTFAFYVASPTRSIQCPHLMNPLQRGTRNSFLSATEKSYERAIVNRSAIVNL
jgi:hypothetical protein